MSEPRELFLHELGDILYAENVLVKALPKMAQEADDADLSTGFEEHLDETKKHVDVLEQVFETLGEKPKAEKCPGIDGITKEHDEFFSPRSGARGRRPVSDWRRSPRRALRDRRLLRTDHDGPRARRGRGGIAPGAEPRAGEGRAEQARDGRGAHQL